MKLEGLALVTGASRGIGRAIALDLARSGARVVGTATSESGAAAITDAFSQAGLPGEGAVLDVNDAQAAEALLDPFRALTVPSPFWSITPASPATVWPCA